MEEDIQKFRVFNKLKTVYRFSSVENRKESTAEHTWACLILADYFLSKLDLSLNRLRVYELLMYHDVVEIQAGDTPLHPSMHVRVDKKEKEQQAAEILQNDLPSPLDKKFMSLFTEFEKRETPEAQFAKAIDVLEAEIHELDYKDDCKGWTKEFLIEQKLKHVEMFPALKKVFFELITYMEEKGYFNQ